MDEAIVLAKGINSLEVKSCCRLCLGGIDEQTLSFSNYCTGELFDRIQQCTGVVLVNFPDVRPTACDGCVSQLVICEKFVKQCREVDSKLRHLLQQCNDIRAATGQNETLKPIKQQGGDEDIPVVKVQHPKPKIDETACDAPYNGKSTGDDIYVVEIVDTNHEYEIDHCSENIPDKCGVNARNIPGKKESSQGRKSVNKTKCSICGIMQQNLKQHMVVHTGERKHKCSVCQKAFTQRGNLTYHMLQHQDLRPYRCGQCDKAFKNPQSLRSHKLKHTDERNFKCDVCNETFKYKCSLVVHTKTHTQDKRYSCTECQRSFITSWRLKKHMRTHTDERPYKCTDCGKCFKASHNLSLHRRSHTKERRYQCNICGCWFSYRNVLKTHMNVHLKADKMHRKQDTEQKLEKSDRRVIKS